MDIEHSIKKISQFDLEDSPFGPKAIKFENAEPSVSNLSMELFNNNTSDVKK